MSKTKFRSKRSDAIVERGEVYAHYVAKYFNLFLNRFVFEGDIGEQEVAFIMRQFWRVGTIACFKLKGSEGSDEFPRGMPVFTPYAVNEWNLYNYPVSVTLIALRGVKFVPMSPQRVDVDACIGFIQRNREPVFRVVDYYARRLATTDMVLQINLLVQKYPWLIGTTPEGADKARALADMLLSDNPSLFLELEEVDKAKALVSGAPYIIDKLQNYKIALENELREYLGLTNLGVAEKKEHLLNREVDANNEVTSASGDAFFDCLSEFFDRVRKYLGIDIRVKLNAPEPVPQEKGEDEADDGEEEGGNEND